VCARLRPRGSDHDRRGCAVNPEVFAEWFRRQGHRVVRTAGSWWYEASPRVWQAFPHHWTLTPAPGELEELLRSQRAVALRCSVPLDAPEGRVSYHTVWEGADYGIVDLHGSVRGVVRKGMQRAQVEPVPLARLAEEGWELEVDTCRRQGRAVPLTREAWRRRHLAAADLPGFEAWGALVEGRLGACLLCVRVDDWCEALSHQSHSDFLAARINNALTFGFTEGMTRRPGVKAIFYGLEGLDAPATVDEFKFRMGYRPVPVRQRVALHPWIPAAAVAPGHRVLAAAARRRPTSGTLGKAEGMLRFHLEGKRPAVEQRWPECLREERPPARARASAAAPAPAAPVRRRGQRRPLPAPPPDPATAAEPHP